MPPRKYMKKAPKPSMKKAQAMVTKKNKAKAKKNMDTFFFKSKVTATLTPQQGVRVANFVANTFTLDPTGASAAYINNAEFQLYRQQFDKFRVNSVTVRFTPKANVLDQANNNNDNALNTLGDGMVHTCIDRDGPVPQSVAVMSRYPSYRAFSVLKKWSRTYVVKYPTGIWVDCQNSGAFSMNKELGLSGGISLYAENILEDNYEAFNEPWGTVVVEHNIVFQGKVSSSLGGIYDGSGNIIGVQVIRIVEPGVGTQTPLTYIRGTLNDTRTVSETVQQPIDDLGDNIEA